MKRTQKIFLFILIAGIILTGLLPVAVSQEINTNAVEFGIEELPPPIIDQSDQSADTSNLFSDKIELPKDEIVSLRFAWNSPVNMAAFTRNGKIWVVFDRPERIDVETLKAEAKHMAKEIYTLPHPGGSIVVITPNPGVKYALRKEGLLWIVDLYTGRPPNFAVKNLTIFTQYDSLKNSYLFVPTNFAGKTISLIDPEIGDII